MTLGLLNLKGGGRKKIFGSLTQKLGEILGSGKKFPHPPPSNHRPTTFVIFCISPYNWIVWNPENLIKFYSLQVGQTSNFLHYPNAHYRQWESYRSESIPILLHIRDMLMLSSPFSLQAMCRRTMRANSHCPATRLNCTVQFQLHAGHSLRAMKQSVSSCCHNAAQEECDYKWTYIINNNEHVVYCFVMLSIAIFTSDQCHIT